MLHPMTPEEIKELKKSNENLWTQIMSQMSERIKTIEDGQVEQENNAWADEPEDDTKEEMNSMIDEHLVEEEDNLDQDGEESSLTLEEHLVSRRRGIEGYD